VAAAARQRQLIFHYRRGVARQRQFIFYYRHGVARQRQFIFYDRRGAAAAASKKRKFKKLVNLHKIFILKNATL